jgi:hypothetical protein
VLSSPVWRGGPEAALGAGLLVGAVVSAAGVLVLGSLIRWAAFGFGWLVVYGACGVLLLREFRVVSFALPQNARLIPHTVFRHGPYLGSFEFGFELGTGIRTYVTSSLPYAVVVAVALVSSPIGAVSTGVGFGLGRLLMTMAAVRYDDPEDRWPSWSDAWDRSAAALQAMLSGGFVALLVAAFLLGR